MSKRKEVLRLLSLGMSQRSIAKSLKVSGHMVVEMRDFCKKRSIGFEEAMKLSDEEIEGKKREEVKASDAKRPDCAYIHSELKKKGVTHKLLHSEYVEECIVSGQEYLRYTQFCNVYKEYVEDNRLTMHIERKPGERIEVDWAGGTIPINDATQKETVDKAYLFVGCCLFPNTCSPRHP